MMIKCLLNIHIEYKTSSSLLMLMAKQFWTSKSQTNGKKYISVFLIGEKVSLIGEMLIFHSSNNGFFIEFKVLHFTQIKRINIK